MNKALSVSVIQGAGNLLHDRQRFTIRQRALPFQALLQRAAGHVFHGDEEPVPVFVDLGLQSAWDDTLARIGRGHDAAAFAAAAEQLAGIPGVLPIAHMILGLPGEDAGRMRESFRWLARRPLHGVKIHHLQVVRGTPLEADYRAGRLPVFSPESYVPLVADVLEELPWAFVIHRLVGDQPEESLVAPRWARSKGRVLDDLAAEFQRRGTRQGFRAGRSEK